MAGPVAPDSWQGGINITYKIGPGFVNTDEYMIKLLHFAITKNSEFIRELPPVHSFTASLVTRAFRKVFISLSN